MTNEGWEVIVLNSEGRLHQANQALRKDGAEWWYWRMVQHFPNTFTIKLTLDGEVQIEKKGRNKY